MLLTTKWLENKGFKRLDEMYVKEIKFGKEKTIRWLIATEDEEGFLTSQYYVKEIPASVSYRTTEETEELYCIVSGDFLPNSDLLG